MDTIESGYSWTQQKSTILQIQWSLGITQMRYELGLAVLRALPKLPQGQVLLHHKQEASCIYVNNAGPWNAIMHLGHHGAVGTT